VGASECLSSPVASVVLTGDSPLRSGPLDNQSQSQALTLQEEKPTIGAYTTLDQVTKSSLK